MNHVELEAYCLGKKGAVKTYPFDQKTAVFKVGGKMFALTDERSDPVRVNLKCDPLYALELRSLYAGVTAGYHMNKKHWNTVACGEIEDALIKSWIDDSYLLVVRSLAKKVRDSLG